MKWSRYSVKVSGFMGSFFTLFHAHQSKLSKNDPDCTKNHPAHVWKHAAVNVFCTRSRDRSPTGRSPAGASHSRNLTAAGQLTGRWYGRPSGTAHSNQMWRFIPHSPLRKKKRKGKFELKKIRRNRTDGGLNNFIWAPVPSVPSCFCWMGLMLLIRQADFPDSKVALICQCIVHSSVRWGTEPLKLKCHIKLSTKHSMLWAAMTEMATRFFCVCVCLTSFSWTGPWNVKKKKWMNGTCIENSPFRKLLIRWSNESPSFCY